MTGISKRIKNIVLFVLLASLLAGCVGHGATGKVVGSALPEGSATKAETSASPAATKGASTAAATESPAPTAEPTAMAQPIGTLADGWIVGIPDYVPRFTCGSIDRSQSKILQGSNGTVFLLCIKKVAKADIDTYAKALQAKGYTVSTAELTDSYTLTASMKLKLSEATIVITWSQATGVIQFTLGVPV